jgi:NitT/TauT family transport system substrate-binding protein
MPLTARSLPAILLSAVFALAITVSSPARAERVTVTHWGVLMYGAPYAVAISKGFYKEAGLDIDGVLTSQGGGTTMRNVMASDLPYGEVALSAALAAMKQGIKLRIIHSGVRTAGEILWVTTPDSGINSIKDLDGKKVAITAPKSVTDMLLIMVADKNKIKPDAVVGGGIGGGLTMVEHKGAVAAPIMDPVWSRMKAKFKPVFMVKDELPAMVQTVGVTTEDYAAANKDKLKKLIAARRKAVDFIYANPNEAAQIVAAQYGLDPGIAASSIKNLIDLKYWSAGDFEYDAMDNMAKGLQIIGELDGKVDWKTLVDESYLK